MKKKKSPITEAIESIHCVLEQMDERAASRHMIHKSLREIEWNLSKAWSENLVVSPYLAQALGIVKGLRSGIGDDFEVKP